MALRVGITGGIGSGKSTVARVFNVLGIPVYYADEAARRLMNEDPEIKEGIIQAFGEESYSGNQLNRAHIAQIVFNNPSQLEVLNSITHPATISDAERWMQNQTAPYSIKEAALIFESGSAENLDFVIGVYTPAPLRIHRVMQRDKLTRDEVKARMDRQIEERIKMKLCDAVIINDEQQMVIPQVMELHERLVAMAGIP